MSTKVIESFCYRLKIIELTLEYHFLAAHDVDALAWAGYTLAVKVVDGALEAAGVAGDNLADAC